VLQSGRSQVRFPMRSFFFSIGPNGPNEEDEMGGPCSTNGGEEERL
jgi:hypothetical protein